MDLHSLQQLQACTLLVLGLVVLLAHQSSRVEAANASVRWFFCGAMSGALGLELQSFRGVWPSVIAIVLGNFFFLLMIVMINKAIALSVDYGGPIIRYYLALTLGTTAILTYYLYGIPYLQRRLLVAALVLPIFLGPTVVLLLRVKRPELRGPAWTMAAIFIAQIISSLAFIFSLLRGSHLSSNVRWTGVILIAGMCMCFLWMDMQRTRAELSTLAMTDPLTGLLNRRAMELMAPRELAWAVRKRTPLSLLTVDIDYFKRINDRYGHLAGDMALLGVSEVLRDVVRKQDLAVRTGGDEFMLLLIDSSTEIADLVASRIHDRMSRLALQSHEKTPFDVTVTVGRFTMIPDQSTSYAELLHASDVDLYRRKQLRVPPPSGGAGMEMILE